jgi:hypothetical protein
MPEEPTTPELAEREERLDAALRARDFDAAANFYAHDGVLHGTRGVLGELKGREAIRAFLAEWFGGFEEFEYERRAARDLGHGVRFGVIDQRGRRAGSTGWVQDRVAVVAEWSNGLIQRATTYSDIDEGRAEAERLAGERGG